MGDAMVELAGRSLGAVTSINRRDAYRTYVHLDTEGAWLTGKPRLPRQIAEKLTCDGILQPVWHTQGAPVNVGRAQRIVPSRTRRLVEDRDRGCRFPGCTSTHVECHHLIPWADGGPTDTPNLAGLCPFHHDAHHNGDFTISGNADNPDGLRFTSRGGFPIRPGPTFTTPALIIATDPRPGTPQPTGAPVSSGSGSPTPDPPGAPPATTPYRGPSGDKLSLRWVTFDQPREPAFI
jgi:HNH endonuclease